MKLSKLYSNCPERFHPIEFSQEINIVLAKIRLPENKRKHTHNLGKTILGRLIDFCFLSKKDKNFFLFNKLDLFEQFDFFLEIELFDASYLTIKRGVKEATKISFKKHDIGNQDYSSLEENQWTHSNISFEKAKFLLNTLLDWSSLKEWPYRKMLGYLLRSQDDFRDVFQLNKFKSQHSDWKPFLADIIGLDAKLIKAHYDNESEIESVKEKIKYSALSADSELTINKIDNILLLKNKESEKIKNGLNEFNFHENDKKITKDLIEEVDAKIANLNSDRYYLGCTRERIQQSLKEGQIIFDPDQAKLVYEQAGICFDGQIKKSFEQLIEFNKAITNERIGYLRQELKEVKQKISLINSELNELNHKRSTHLSFLKETDSFDKYKSLSKDLVDLESDIKHLETQKESLFKINDLKEELSSLQSKCLELAQKIQENIQKVSPDKVSRFSYIRLYFSDIIEQVINRKALLNIEVNNEDHIEFSAKILNENNNNTNAGEGNSFRKLLCVAFDLAVIRAHLTEKFPRFVYHDGVFESMDDRVKDNLMNVYKEYASYGIQSVITLIDSDIPKEGDADFFASTKIVLQLHDEGESGRLFKTTSW